MRHLVTRFVAVVEQQRMARSAMRLELHRPHVPPRLVGLVTAVAVLRKIHGPTIAVPETHNQLALRVLLDLQMGRVVEPQPSPVAKPAAGFPSFARVSHLPDTMLGTRTRSGGGLEQKSLQGELWMRVLAVGIERCQRMHERARRAGRRLQIAVAPLALPIFNPGQPLVVTMLAVALGTRKTIVTVAGDLVAVMQCPVMAGQALAVVDRTDRSGIDPVGEPLERGPGGVTGPAVVFDHAVSGRNTAGGKHPMLAASPLGTDPGGGGKHRKQRDPRQPAPQPTTAATREVDLDPLGQFTTGRQPVHTLPRASITTPTEPPAG